MITLNRIKIFAAVKYACDTYFEPFKRAIRNKDKKLAWQIVAMNIEWLNAHGLGIELNDIPMDVDGEVYLLNEKGDLIISSNIKNRMKNGKHIVYYDNGKKSIKSHYKDNVLDGNYKTYNDDGTLAYNYNCKNGFIHGEYIKLWYNGLVNEICNYDMGKLNGEKRIYYLSGNISTIRNYKNGKVHGEEIYFNEDGLKTAKYNYRGGLLNGDHYNYKDGRITCITRYVDDHAVRINEIFYYQE